MLDTDRAFVAVQPEGANFDNGEVDTRSNQELEEEIAEICVHIDAATYRLLRAIAEFDRREAWGVGFPSTAHWLCWRAGLDLVTAREKVRVARALEGLPRISEAFRQGKLSYSKVRAMTRIGSPENEEYLLYIAENGTACHMEALVRAYRRACRGDDVEEARRQRADRYLEMYTDDDGMVVIRGRLPQEVAALLEKALEAAMDALEEGQKRGQGRTRFDSDRGPLANASAEETKAGACDCRPGSLDSPASTGKRRVRDDSAETSGEVGQTIQDDSAEACQRSGPVPTDDSARESRGSISGVSHKNRDMSLSPPYARIPDDSMEASGEEGETIQPNSAGELEEFILLRCQDTSTRSGATVGKQTGHDSAEASVRPSGGAKDDSAEAPERSVSEHSHGGPASPVSTGSWRVQGDSAEASGEDGQTIQGDSAETSWCRNQGANDDSAEAWRRETIAQRRVDALGLLLEAALGRGLAGTQRGEPCQVMIHVDANVLSGGSDEGRCELEIGQGISAETCRRLACDAPHVTVAQDPDGNVLNLGRKARKLSTPLWRALMSRDRTCRFPGCARTRHLQAHHIEHWAKGGETNPENLLILCRAHHWAVHEGGVQVEGRAPHGLVFLRPDGSVLPACPVPVPINGEAGETLKEANRKHGLEITADTVDCFWDGESIDYDMAVDALLSHDDDEPIDEE